MFSNGQTPKWLQILERRLGWIAIPQIASVIVLLQGAGFLMVSSNPAWLNQLALIPEAVQAGEFWRLITLLALPISLNPIWILFTLLFLYFVLNTLENEWGAFKTTLYVLISIVLTDVFSMLTGYPVLSARQFESSLFLAVATLFPNHEVLLFVVPVKMKFLAFLSAFLILKDFVQGDWLDRAYLVVVFSNFFLFFGPAVLTRVHATLRRRKFRNQMRD